MKRARELSPKYACNIPHENNKYQVFVALAVHGISKFLLMFAPGSMPRPPGMFLAPH
jgi:hypothetical protein